MWLTIHDTWKFVKIAERSSGFSLPEIKRNYSIYQAYTGAYNVVLYQSETDQSSLSQ